MDTQTSTDYTVDNRYREAKPASDNRSGLSFLRRYTEQRKAASANNMEAERREDDRFVMSAPGWGNAYSYKNAYGSPRSPAQRRVSAMNQ